MVVGLAFTHTRDLAIEAANKDQVALLSKCTFFFLFTSTF
jgi:hypothetical protein